VKNKQLLFLVHKKNNKCSENFFSSALFYYGGVVTVPDSGEKVF